MRVLRALVYVASLVCFAAMVAGYFGWVHPAFDSFSAFRVHLAVLTLVSGLLVLVAGGRLGGLSFSVAAAVVLYTTFATTIITPANSVEKSARYRLLQVNVRFDNPTPKLLLQLIAKTKPDVIAAQEVTPDWRGEFATIKSTYPYQLFCKAHRKIGEVAILSRRPFVDSQSNYCGNGAAIAIQGINFGGKTIHVASTHLHWPWPHEQARQVADMRPTLETLDQDNNSLLIAGDLNAPRWSQTAREIAKYSGANPIDYSGSSWLPYELPKSWTTWLGLPIDNVFASSIDVLSIETQQNVGSDHLPILLEFKIDRTPTADTNLPAVG